MKWLIVLGVAVLIVLIGSVGRIPFSERQLATSEETRAAAKADQAPRYTRAQAISMVEKHIRVLRHEASALPSVSKFAG